MTRESPRPPTTGRDVCGAPGALGGVCCQPATHEVEVNAPKRGHDVSRRCGDCADSARDRTYVRDVRPITLDADAEEAAAAIYEYYRYTQATRDSLGYTPGVRVDPEEERLHVARGGLLYIATDSDWRPPSALLEDAPSYFEVTHPTWADTSDWLYAASACVRQTITDADGREWSLPTSEIAAALRARAGSTSDDEGDAAPGHPGRRRSGTQSVPRREPHWCGRCDRPFDAVKDLVNHTCGSRPSRRRRMNPDIDASGPYRWGPSNYACPECGDRMQAKTGPDGITVERCPYCEWVKVFDPAADECPVKELDRI